MERNTEAAKLATLAGGAVLALFFAGQVFNFAARWAGRAVSGAALILTALCVAYVTYEVYTGWRAAGETSTDSIQDYSGSQASRQTVDQNSVDDIEQEYLNDELTEAEFEHELDKILNEKSE